MTEVSLLLSGSFEEWTAALPPYQRELLAEMRTSSASDEDLVDTWLNASVATNTSGYGGGGMSVYAEHFRNHLHDFLCSQKQEYVQQREGIFAEAGLGKVTLVAALTQVISPLVVAAPPLIAPAVAVSLYLIGQMGLKTWCSVQTERRGSTPQLP